MTELLPCPFCGGEAVNSSHHSCDCCGKAFNGVVSCKVCDASIGHLDTSAEADAAWNSRHAVGGAAQECCCAPIDYENLDEGGNVINPALSRPNQSPQDSDVGTPGSQS